MSQFAVSVGITSSPLEMDFSEVKQAKILQILEDKNIGVSKFVNAPRKQAVDYMTEGFLELNQKHINFDAVK